jgi:hypothetical protein
MIHADNRYEIESSQKKDRRKPQKQRRDNAISRNSENKSKSPRSKNEKKKNDRLWRKLKHSNEVASS